MSRDKTKAVTPRLRFPEFRDAGPWEVRRLGEVADCYQPETISVSSTSEDGGYPVYGANGIIGYFDRYNHEEPEVIVGCRGQCGNVFLTPPKSWITGNSMVIRTKRDQVASKKFLFYSLTSSDLSYLITGSAQPQITGEIKRHRVSFPSPLEQQKIADCLSSLDDLIRVEASRLEALQAHKKGLMQQLFPTEGETTPRLRFPEFRDAGPWEVKRLGEVAMISNGLTADQSSDSNGLKVTRIETISEGSINIDKVGYINRIEGVERFRLRVGDILFSHINSQSHIGKTALVEEDLDLYHGMNLLRLQVDDKENNPRFIYYLLNTEFFRESVRARSNQAVNQASINQTEVGNSKIAVPSANEQQKIADCLSSLDNLIRAQGERIEALKQHKKGLMQQLFPQEVL